MNEMLSDQAKLYMKKVEPEFRDIADEEILALCTLADHYEITVRSFVRQGTKRYSTYSKVVKPGELGVYPNITLALRKSVERAAKRPYRPAYMARSY